MTCDSSSTSSSEPVTVVEVYPDGRIEPCLVIRSRYDGTFEGGRWLAFPTISVPSGARGGDGETIAFFNEHSWWVGIADTPEDAVENLRLKLADIRAGSCIQVIRY